MISVYQAKNPTFLAKRTAVTVGEVINEFHHVATVDTDDLEVAYERTNTITQPWWTNEGVNFKGSPDHGMKGCRSTSVGDLMVTCENGLYHTYMVAGCGFKELVHSEARLAQV